MIERRIYIDVGLGEARGVVTRDGRPERLLIERAGHAYPRLGEHHDARVLKIDRGSGLALLGLAGGGQAAFRLKADRAPPTQGQALRVQIAIEPQGGKDAVARIVAPGEEDPAAPRPADTLEGRLALLAPGAPVVRDHRARAAADKAEEEALAVEHALPGGGSLAVEPTRALTAVDVDLGSGGGGDPKRVARQANLTAIAALARLLRLKSIGGLVVLDLVGRGHDGPALSKAAHDAFGPDQPGVVIGPITKFGTLELALPRRYRPVHDILCDAAGRPSSQTLALRFLRAVEGQARADPGGRLVARCAPEVAQAALPYQPALAGIIGARFDVVPDPALDRDRFEIGS